MRENHVFGVRFYEPTNLDAAVELVETRYLWTETAKHQVVGITREA
jgi:hypothetical protein